MLHHLYLNQQSCELINNIWHNAKLHPSYANYNVIKDAASYSRNGAIAIKIESPSKARNMFLFCPAADGSGKIGSVAIYGVQLEGHKRAIERSMTIFGLPVESVEWDNGFERFLDVTLKDYIL